MDGTTEYPLINANELAEQAWTAMTRRDAGEALRLWQALREHSPERPEGHVWAVQLLWQQGRLDEAETLAKAAFAALPDDPELFVQHAWIATAGRRWPDAAERWAAVRTRAPERREGYVWGTHALWQSGQADRAETVVAEGLRRFPGDLEMMAESGWTATARQQWPEALRRWTQVNQLAPERVDAQVRTIQALRMVGRYDDSEKMARAALAHRPDDTELVIEHIWAAIGRSDWKSAAARYDQARRDARHQPRLSESLGPMEARMRDLANADGTGNAGSNGMVTAPPPAAAPAPRDDTMTALMLGFESMGERCDFGAVQRYYGAEPLGLLRFAWSRLDPLVAALDDRFGAVGGADDTVFDLYGDETIIWMKKYNLLFHTFVYGVEQQPQDKREAFYQQQRRRLIFLREKLIADLEEPQKILIYSTDQYAADEEVAGLFAAVRRYGPNSLLYVRPETGDRPAGTVERLEDGLYAGYFTGLTDFVSGNQPPFELWRELCLKSRALAPAPHGS